MNYPPQIQFTDFKDKAETDQSVTLNMNVSRSAYQRYVRNVFNQHICGVEELRVESTTTNVACGTSYTGAHPQLPSATDQRQRFHFAPKDETLKIGWTFSGYEHITRVKLELFSVDQRTAFWTKMIKWQGGTCPEKGYTLFNGMLGTDLYLEAKNVATDVVSTNDVQIIADPGNFPANCLTIQGARYKLKLTIVSRPGINREPESRFLYLDVIGRMKLKMLDWRQTYPKADKDHYPLGEDVPTRIKWMQYRLNELGYFAGPVSGAETEDLKKANMRYRINHGGALYRRLFDYFPNDDDRRDVCADAISDLKTFDFNANPAGVQKELVTALEQSRKPRQVVSDPSVFSNPDFPDEAKIYVDNDCYYLGSYDSAGPEDMSIIDQDTTSGAFVKAARERAWLSDPHLPLEVEVLVRKSNDQEVAVPEAAAGLRVKWDWESNPAHPQLPIHSAAQPNRTVDYVQRAFRELNGGLPDKHKHNLRFELGGLVTPDLLTNCTNIFIPYEPFDIQAAECSSRVGGPADSQELRARSRVYFRPSIIASDSYRIQAILEIVSPGQAAPIATLEVRSGWVRIWRRIHVTAYVVWPPRDDANKIRPQTWTGVKEKFCEAFVEVDTSGMQQITMSNEIVRLNPEPAQCGPERNDLSYYYFLRSKEVEEAKTPQERQERRRVLESYFSPLAIFPNKPMMITGRGAADALLMHKVLRSENEQWCKSAKDGKTVTATVAAAKKLVDYYNQCAPALLRRVGAHFGPQFDARMETPGSDLIWKNIPAGGSRPDMQVFADDEVPADAVADLENAINDLVVTPVARAIGAGDNAALLNLLSWLYECVHIGWSTGTNSILKLAGDHFKAQLERFAIKQTVKAPADPAKPFALRPNIVSWVFAPNRPDAIQRFTIPDEVVKSAIEDTVKGHCEKIADTVNLDLQRYVRQEKGYGDGIIYLDAKPHVNVRSAMRGRNYTYPGLNAGASGGFFVTSQHTRNEMVHLLTHEMCHCMFLRHYKNASNYQPLEHDLSDDNCIMSYGFNLRDIRLSFKWNDAKAGYEVKATFTDNEGTDAKFDRLVEFSSPGNNLWWSTFNQDRKHQQSIKVASEGYIAKACLYVDTAAGNINVKGMALADVTQTIVLPVPADKIQPTPANIAGSLDQELPNGPISMLGGYGSGAHYHFPDNYKPSFCGKCNLVLRGWNLSQGNWPPRA